MIIHTKLATLKNAEMQNGIARNGRILRSVARVSFASFLIKSSMSPTVFLTSGTRVEALSAKSFIAGMLMFTFTSNMIRLLIYAEIGGKFFIARFAIIFVSTALNPAFIMPGTTGITLYKFTMPFVPNFVINLKPIF